MHHSIELPFKVWQYNSTDEVAILRYQKEDMRDFCYYEHNRIFDRQMIIVTSKGAGANLANNDWNIIYKEPVVIWHTNCPLIHWMLQNSRIKSEIYKWGFKEETASPFQVISFLLKFFVSKMSYNSVITVVETDATFTGSVRRLEGQMV
jgi:hypothetical protein